MDYNYMHKALRIGFHGKLHSRRARLIAHVMAFGALAFPILVRADSTDDLGRLSLEELSNLEVTSVFKRPEPLSRAPASIYVITQEEIRRSGAVSLPEVLRLAPNLEVARVDATSYAISARGFNTFQASNKLLVMIDGRSVYTPLHAGVYWDQQQVPLSEIERIEVVSGPGGTLWGANAVNGVINVVTRRAYQSQDGLVVGQLGDIDRSITARYSGQLGESGAFRAYGMTFKRGDTLRATGASPEDAWTGVQGGFRTDWSTADHTLTVQGDAFSNAFDLGNIHGGNLLSRYTLQTGASSELQVQGYYDQVHRDVNQVFDSLDTFDLTIQQTIGFLGINQLVWGAGYRSTHDKFINSLNGFVLVPDRDTVELGNAFVQDTIATSARTTLTAGLKLEHSSFSGWEVLPSVRFAWTATEDSLLWAAVSRAARTPSRIDRELTFTGLLDQAPQFDSESVIAYELGYRGQPVANTSLSVSLFYNDYRKLRMLTRLPSGRLRFDNAMEGSTYGAELWGDYQITNWWRLMAGITFLQKDLDLASNAFLPVLNQHAGNDPRRQFFFRSSMDLAPRLEFDVALRSIDHLSDPHVPGYTELDARIGWRIHSHLDLVLAGFNLLHDQHPETGAAPARNELRRSGHLELRWAF